MMWDNTSLSCVTLSQVQSCWRLHSLCFLWPNRRLVQEELFWSLGLRLVMFTIIHLLHQQLEETLVYMILAVVIFRHFSMNIFEVRTECCVYWLNTSRGYRCISPLSSVASSICLQQQERRQTLPSHCGYKASRSPRGDSGRPFAAPCEVIEVALSAVTWVQKHERLQAYMCTQAAHRAARRSFSCGWRNMLKLSHPEYKHMVPLTASSTFQGKSPQYCMTSIRYISYALCYYSSASLKRLICLLWTPGCVSKGLFSYSQILHEGVH